MLPLAVGTLLAVGALAFVLLPLFHAVALVPRRRAASRRETARATEHEAIAALREIEFDRATGKLSDADYGELKSRYTAAALDAMRAGDSTDADADSTTDPAEAAVRAIRARLKRCVRCGPRPEPDATYCSNCGLYLPGACTSCGAAVKDAGAAYCGGCGRGLAA